MQAEPMPNFNFLRLQIKKDIKTSSREDSPSPLYLLQLMYQMSSDARATGS